MNFTFTVIKQRDITFDIVRGIGILLMILGHIGYPLNTFIYLFHMALFFIISGYFFSDKCYQSLTDVKNFIFRKIKTLYIPFILWNIILVFLHNFFISINLYSVDYVSVFRGVSFEPTHFYTLAEIVKKVFYSLLFFHQERFGGATWFLRVLFFVSVFSCIGHYLIHKYFSKKKVNYIIALFYIFCFIIGYGLSVEHFNFYSIGTMFTVSGLFYIGILLKRFGIYFANKNNPFYLFILSSFVLIISSLFNIKIEISSNLYPNSLFLILISYCGFVFIHYISTYIEKIKNLYNIFIILGQNTLYLLLFNTISFKIFSYLQIKFFNYPIEMLSSYPVIYENIIYTWFYYLLSGIFGSFILKYILIFIFTYINKTYRTIKKKSERF